MKQDISIYINEYGNALSRLCRSLCTSEQDAEDLYQTTWEKVIKGIKKYNKEKPFDKWLWSVCINAHRDMLKNPFRRKVIAFESSEELERLLCSIPDSEQNRDDYIILHRAIKKLDPKKRQVVALFYFKDYSIQELAEILAIPEGTVKSRLSSAREQIRKELNYE